MNKRSILAASIAAFMLAACATTPEVKPMHNFSQDSKVGDTTVTRQQKCHAANDVGAGGISGILLGPIGFIGGLAAGEWYSHKECK